jgi:hypothetical protein
VLFLLEGELEDEVGFDVDDHAAAG